MSCLQAARVKPFISIRRDSLSLGLRSKPSVRVASFNQKIIEAICKGVPATANYTSAEASPALFQFEGSAWKSLENAIECFGKDQSIEDVLRQQIEKQEFYDDGSRGGKPPRQGGGGGGDSGGGEDDGHSDETLQVVLGTLGFILLYVFIITGEELARLAKDYIKYLFGGNKSVRLRKAMYEWGRFFGRMTQSWEMDPYLEGEGDHL
ncbi:hypothetical protein SAY86_010682 [Trapa natans]|uniref:Glycine-rich protein n=1 Tax=Trapa natans TaxID=22666 RepID=A0AAN7LKX4_TRANT|nr:hypothetical protein SAY86_010682 [Trapa natans]